MAMNILSNLEKLLYVQNGYHSLEWGGRISPELVVD
jgi:hypothetical protein